MSPKARFLFAAAALAIGTTKAASATDWLGNGSYCGGSGFSTCFSVILSWSGSGTSISVVLQLRNDDTFNCSPADCLAGPLKWFAVGIDQLPADIASTFTSGPSGYSQPPPNDINNPGGPFTPGVAEAANPGGSFPGTGFRTWNFTFTGDARTALAWDAVMQDAGVGYHAGGVDPCPSTKVEVHGTGPGGTGPYVTNSGPPSPCDVPGTSPPTEVVPEPATMSLMAIGLVGLGAGAIRRRNRKI